jgi:hypothetical protein
VLSFRNFTYLEVKETMLREDIVLATKWTYKIYKNLMLGVIFTA